MTTPFHMATLALDEDGLDGIPPWAYYCAELWGARIYIMPPSRLTRKFGRMAPEQTQAIRQEIYNRIVVRELRRIEKP